MSLKFVCSSDQMLKSFWGKQKIPTSVNGTLLDYISTENNGWVFDGAFHSIAQVMGLDNECLHCAEHFSVRKVLYQGTISHEDVVVEDWIEGNIREFVTKIFRQIGGALTSEEVEANRNGPMWISRLRASPDKHWVLRGDCNAVNITIEPLSS